MWSDTVIRRHTSLFYVRQGDICYMDVCTVINDNIIKQ